MAFCNRFSLLLFFSLPQSHLRSKAPQSSRDIKMGASLWVWFLLSETKFEEWFSCIKDCIRICHVWNDSLKLLQSEQEGCDVQSVTEACIIYSASPREWHGLDPPLIWCYTCYKILYYKYRYSIPLYNFQLISFIFTAAQLLLHSIASNNSRLKRILRLKRGNSDPNKCFFKLLHQSKRHSLILFTPRDTLEFLRQFQNAQII